MALSRVTTWNSGDVLGASVLNGEFNNILNNALSLISPLTGALAAGDNDITGLDELAFTDAVANATATGRLRRNGNNLTWHNGTTAAAFANLADSPTWTGTHTWSGAGARIAMSNTDSMITVGGSADPGFTVGAYQIGTRHAIYNHSTTGSAWGYNVYTDGTAKYIAADVAMRLIIGDGGFTLYTAPTGVANNAITFTAEFQSAGNGTILGSPVGGAKGAGTLNATAVYDDNVLLTDWAFDLYFDGAVREGDQFYRGQRLYPLAETLEVARTERRLPWMPTRASFEAERGLGAMISRLWFGQEQQQTYIFELERRLAALEAH